MKPCCTLMLLLVLMGFSQVKAQKKSNTDSVRVTLRFNNNVNNNLNLDSVYVILDRWDLSGAGMIKKMYHPKDNVIVLDKIPRGKYYIDVFCLGIYQQTFSEVSWVYNKRKNRNTFHFRLKESEYYSDSTVRIPPERIDLMKLTVVNNRTYK
jgi:hypothetical protein